MQTSSKRHPNDIQASSQRRPNVIQPSTPVTGGGVVVGGGDGGVVVGGGDGGVYKLR